MRACYCASVKYFAHADARWHKLDEEEWSMTFREQALALNEIFARQLLELPLSRQPFLMWLETSWRGTPNPSPSPSPDTDPDPASRSSPLTPALTLP